MTIEDELKGVDDIYLPLIKMAQLDIVDYLQELRAYNSVRNPFHALVRRGINRNIETQIHFLQKIMADYQIARRGAISNYKR
jgi:hypothetical protein